MLASDFRRIVLGMEGAFEASHMRHPDFRAHGRIFATLDAEETHGVVMLTPEQQQIFLAEHPAMFSPAAGAWGRAGSTVVHLDTADEDTVGQVVTLAWQNAAAKATAKKRPAARTSRKSTASPRKKSAAMARKKTKTPARRKKPRR